MELRQLEHFLAVAEEGSFTRAASRLFMVQSSLSASLRSLERELGTDLVTRGRRGTELTDAGRRFLEPARSALAEARRAHEAVTEMTGRLQGSVRIAVGKLLPRGADLGDTIRWFQRRHPAVDVELVPADPARTADLVAEGDVDFAIASSVERNRRALRFQPLLRTPLVVFCPPQHRLAGLGELRPEQLVAEPVVDLPRGWRSRELFDTWLDEHGRGRRASLQVNGPLALVAMVRRGMGISYAPLDCLDQENGAGIAMLAGAPICEIGILSRDDKLRGAVGRAFLTAYLEQCHRNRPPAA